VYSSDEIKEIEEAFSAAMAERGCGDHHIPADGAWHPFAFPDDDVKEHGSARLKINGSRISGLAKDWRDSGKAILKWDGPPEDDLTPAEKAARKKARQEEVLQEAHVLYAKPDAPNDHPYLLRKGLTNNSGALKQDGADLIVPIWNITTGDLQGVQRITPNGDKFFPKYSVIDRGVAIPWSTEVLDYITRFKAATIVLAEGYSDAASIYAADLGYLPLACFGVGNFAKIAKAANKRWPLRKIVIAANNDPGNPKTLESAHAAAREVFDAKVAVPSLKDFNDVHVQLGAEEVARQIAAAELPPPAPPTPVEQLNKTFALVIVGDKTAVMKTGGEEDVQLLSVAAFNTWHENQFVLYGDKRVPLGKYWLAHPDRRQYEGLVFAPDRDVPGYYNLWQGFAVEPRAGDCSKFKAHLLDNVCGGNQTYYDWLFGFFADIFQNPGAKKGSAVALKGKEGVGKTIVGAIFGSLLGPHYRLVSEPRYVTGRFNSHVVQILLLHADEAFWAGDRSAVGKLNDMITGKQHPIEFKGKEAIWVDNHLRMFTTGDKDWLVPAGFDARRWLVLTVGDDHREDHDYFAAIDKEMVNGGCEALLHELLHFDLSKINLRSVPKTTALFEQKEKTFTIDQTWWYDVLQRGELPHLENGCECPKHMLHEDYLGRTERLGRRAEQRSSETALGMFLSKMVGPALNPNARDAGGRRYYRFPPLKDCRARFAELTHHPIEWSDPNAVWEKERM
jgi:phage/plasmid primase-like uncharacterized protein